jgi:DNA polymerase-3 subunit delta'
MDELVINKSTKSMLELAVKSPSHAYLFYGPNGLGKTTAAMHYARKVLGPGASDGDASRWVLTIAPIDNKKISIKQTAQIKSFISTTNPPHITRKAVVIDQADKLGIEASNSLLLSLEEPASDTVIILVTDNIAGIPVTLRSRLQHINFRLPLQQEIDTLKTAYQIPQSIASMVGRRPAALSRITKEEFEKYQAGLALSDDFITGNLAERLQAVCTVQDKNLVNIFFDCLSHKLTTTSQPDSDWLKRSVSLIYARLHLYNNGNPKFVLEKLALEFE